MEMITLEWAASVGGVAVLVSIAVRLTKNMLKAESDMMVNIATISYSAALNMLAFVATGRTSLPDIYLLVVQIIVVAAIATFGYEVVSNALQRRNP